MLSEKAKSRAQQKLFGIVRSYQKGELENPSPEVEKIASTMSKTDVKKMASTKHKGLPAKIEERVGGAGTLVRQGVKVGGKSGGRAVQKGTTAATAAGRAEVEKAKQGNQSKLVGSGKWEKRGATVGGAVGTVAGAAIPDGPLMVAGEIAGGFAGSKVGGKIGRQLDKKFSKEDVEGGSQYAGVMTQANKELSDKDNKPKPKRSLKKKVRRAVLYNLLKRNKSKETIKKVMYGEDIEPKELDREIDEAAFLAGLAKSAAAVAKKTVKQKAQEVVVQKAANVAKGAIPQPNRDQQNEGVGRAAIGAVLGSPLGPLGSAAGAAIGASMGKKKNKVTIGGKKVKKKPINFFKAEPKVTSSEEVVHENRMAAYTAGAGEGSPAARPTVSKKLADKVSRSSDEHEFSNRKKKEGIRLSPTKKYGSGPDKDKVVKRANTTGRGTPVRYRKSHEDPDMGRYQKKVTQGTGSIKDLKDELSIVDKMILEYSPTIVYQDKRKGKLGKSSIYSLRDKDESKQDFRKSHVKDVEDGYVGAGHKPTPGSLKKHEEIETLRKIVEEVGISSAAAMENARKEAKLRAQEEAKVASKKKVKEEVVQEADSLSAQVGRWEAARQKRMKQRQSYERPHWIPRDQDHSDRWGSSKGEKKKPQKTNANLQNEAKVDAGKDDEAKEDARNTRRYGHVPYNKHGHSVLRRSEHRMRRGDKTVSYTHLRAHET